MSTTHTSRDFEVELRELRGNLIAMGARCERAVSLAVTAFLDRDPEGAAEVIDLDRRIDRDEIDIDELALRILALRQPVAYDLRFLATTLKFVTDLERIGDKATSIAKHARDIAKATSLPPLSGIEPMSRSALALFRDALDAFVAGDADRADKLRSRSRDVDDLGKTLHREVMDWMRAHPDDLATGLSVISVARQLKRVADHATNLAEQVVFLVRGDDVRHRHLPASSGNPKSETAVDASEKTSKP